MSLIDEVERGLADMLEPEIFGSSLTIDGSVLVGVWTPDDLDRHGDMPGQIVERYRLVCLREDLTAAVGEELTVNNQVWTVTRARTMGLLTDLVLERFAV